MADQYYHNPSLGYVPSEGTSSHYYSRGSQTYTGHYYRAATIGHDLGPVGYEPQSQSQRWLQHVHYGKPEFHGSHGSHGHYPQVYSDQPFQSVRGPLATSSYGTPSEEPTAGTEITTMMIRNIPCRCTREEVMQHFDKAGFVGRYDFFYIPVSSKPKKNRCANLGYGFVNFLTPQDAARFLRHFTGYRFGLHSDKVCEVQISQTQGLEANVNARGKAGKRRTHGCIQDQSRSSVLGGDDSDSEEEAYEVSLTGKQSAALLWLNAGKESNSSKFQALPDDVAPDETSLPLPSLCQ